MSLLRCQKMSIVARCPDCGAEFRRPDSFAGKLEKCPECRHVFSMPNAILKPGSDPSTARPSQTNGALDDVASQSFSAHQVVIRHVSSRNGSQPGADVVGGSYVEQQLATDVSPIGGKTPESLDRTSISLTSPDAFRLSGDENPEARAAIAEVIDEEQANGIKEAENKEVRNSLPPSSDPMSAPLRGRIPIADSASATRPLLQTQTSLARQRTDRSKAGGEEPHDARGGHCSGVAFVGMVMGSSIGGSIGAIVMSLVFEALGASAVKVDIIVVLISFIAGQSIGAALGGGCTRPWFAVGATALGAVIMGTWMHLVLLLSGNTADVDVVVKKLGSTAGQNFTYRGLRTMEFVVCILYAVGSAWVFFAPEDAGSVEERSQKVTKSALAVVFGVLGGGFVGSAVAMLVASKGGYVPDPMPLPSVVLGWAVGLTACIGIFCGIRRLRFK
jgi:hypothetical protein